MYQKLIESYFEASERLSRLSAPAVADRDLRRVDVAFDKIDYSESC